MAGILPLDAVELFGDDLRKNQELRVQAVLNKNSRLARIRVAAGALSVAAGWAMTSAPAAAQSCDSACLESLLSDYVDALVANDPAAAPVAPDVIFSENGVVQPMGEASWLTADARGSYWLPFTDVEASQAGVFTTLEENGEINLMTLRIKVESRRIVEAEQMYVRPSSATFRPIVQDAPDPRLLAPLAPEERVGRDELIAIADSYFEGLDTLESSEITPFWDDCQRRENGMITANNPDPSASEMARRDCKAQFDTGFSTIVTDIRDRRIEVVDVERGLVFGHAFFDHSGEAGGTGPFARPFTFQIAEVFKVRDGKIQQIEAILFSVPYRLRTDFDRLREAQGVEPNHGR